MPECMIDFLQLLPECSVDLTASGLYETAAFGTQGKYRFEDAALVVTAIDGSPVIPAGVPFTFSFQLFNPKGHAPSTPKLTPASWALLTCIFAG